MLNATIPDHISFSIDNVTVKTITPTEEGFWEIGGFDNSVPNPWKHSDHKRMAPFDQKVCTAHTHCNYF